METEEGVEVEEVEEVTPTVGGLASIRDQIREERDAIASKKTLDLLVPGYDQDLIGIRYRAIEQREFEAFAKKQRGGGEEGFNANIEMLVLCCDSILYRKSEGDPLKPALDENGEKIRFDIRLAEAFDLQATSARETLLGLFSPDGAQPFAVLRHVEAVSSWLSGESHEIDQSLLGN